MEGKMWTNLIFEFVKSFSSYYWFSDPKSLPTEMSDNSQATNSEEYLKHRLKFSWLDISRSKVSLDNFGQLVLNILPSWQTSWIYHLTESQNSKYINRGKKCPLCVFIHCLTKEMQTSERLFSFPCVLSNHSVDKKGEKKDETECKM